MREVALDEHLHERHEVRAIKCYCSFRNKSRHSLEVQDCELEVFGRQLLIFGRLRSHPVEGGVVCSEVCTSSSPLKIVLLSKEESKELLGIGGELLDGLVLIRDKLCGNKVLLS